MTAEETARANRDNTIRLNVASSYVGEVQEAIYQSVIPILQNLGKFGTWDNVEGIIREVPMNTEPLKRVLFNMHVQGGLVFAEYAIEQFKFHRAVLLQKEPVDVGTAEIDTTFFQQAMTDFANAEGALKVISISATNRSILSDIVAAASENGWSIPRTVRHMVAFFNGELSGARAVMIARTEVLTASSRANQLVGEEIVKTGIRLRKKWLHNWVGNVREHHVFVSTEKPIMFDDYFNVGNVRMKHPHESGAPASEVINCHCSVAYIPIR